MSIQTPHTGFGSSGGTTPEADFDATKSSVGKGDHQGVHQGGEGKDELADTAHLLGEDTVFVYLFLLSIYISICSTHKKYHVLISIFFLYFCLFYQHFFDTENLK